MINTANGLMYSLGENGKIETNVKRNRGFRERLGDTILNDELEITAIHPFKIEAKNIINIYSDKNGEIIFKPTESGLPSVPFQFNRLILTIGPQKFYMSITEGGYTVFSFGKEDPPINYYIHKKNEQLFAQIISRQLP